MSDKKALVALAKEASIQDSVTKVFDLMGGVTNMIKPGTTVMLKPNAGHASPADTSVCTNPEVVRAVIREVKKANPKSIVIAEAAAIGCDTMECYEVSGIADVAREEGVELYDIKADKDLINVAVRGYRSNLHHVKLPRRLLEADHLINLPILKAHASMVFSCALKNIKGVVQDAVHLQMHQQNLTMAMMDVWSVCRADINIVDAIRPASGYSPHTPVPIEVGCILGSSDPVAVDLIACDLVGIDAEAVDYFRVAAETGLGITERENIDVVGATVAECYKKMWVPYIGDMSTRWPEYKVLCDGACSSCQALLAINMETLKAIGDYERRSDFVVVAGGKNEVPDEVPDEKLVLHGNCTRKYLKKHPNAIHIEGCPPSEPLLYMSISNGELVHGKVGQMSEYIRPRMAADQPVWRKYVEEQAQKFYGSQEG